MIGLDTNVLVRYLTQDDSAQAAQATKLIEHGAKNGELFFLNLVVLCELVWVLESAYECPKDRITSVLHGILSTKHFEVQDKASVWLAFDEYRAQPIDFADALIGRLNKAAGCGITHTFDRVLGKLRHFHVVNTKAQTTT
jgi:predicted nucleic-acid-binding protein